MKATRHSSIRSNHSLHKQNREYRILIFDLNVCIEKPLFVMSHGGLGLLVDEFQELKKKMIMVMKGNGRKASIIHTHIHTYFTKT